MFIRNVNDLKPYLQQNITVDFERIKPHIEFEAEPRFLIYWLGATTYTDLDAKITAASLSPIELQVVKKAQYAIANYAYYFALPAQELQFSNMGVQRMETDTHKAAHGRQIERLRNMLCEAAHSGIEQMLELLETNQVSFPLWTASAQYTMSRELFVNSASEFESIFGIQNSRRTYQAMRHIMKDVEHHILGVTGQPLFDELKTQIKTNSVSSNNLFLLNFIKPCIVWFTIADACKQLPMQVTGNGIHLYWYWNGQDDGQKKPADLNQLNLLAENAKNNAERLLAALRAYLIANAVTYPLFPIADFTTPRTDDFNKPENKIYLF